jgi:hypothetical protein
MLKLHCYRFNSSLTELCSLFDIVCNVLHIFWPIFCPLKQLNIFCVLKNPLRTVPLHKSALHIVHIYFTHICMYIYGIKKYTTWLKHCIYKARTTTYNNLTLYAAHSTLTIQYTGCLKKRYGNSTGCRAS